MRHLFIVFLLAFALTGCSGRDENKAPPAPMYFQHTVKYSGETLAAISEWYTGQASNWKIIAQSNPSLKPERIKIGNIVNIPTHLVVKTKPFPKPVAKVKPKVEQPVVQETTSGATEEKSADVAAPTLENSQTEATEAPEAEEPKTEVPAESDSSDTNTVQLNAEAPPVDDASEREKLREKTRLELLNDVLGTEAPSSEPVKTAP